MLLSLPFAVQATGPAHSLQGAGRGGEGRGLLNQECGHPLSETWGKILGISSGSPEPPKLEYGRQPSHCIPKAWETGVLRLTGSPAGPPLCRTLGDTKNATLTAAMTSFQEARVKKSYPPGSGAPLGKE
jgi:hypothetical protein